MREIQFRAYIKNPAIVVLVQCINFNCSTVEIRLDDGDFWEFDFDEVELMQYTGLKDKNGKGIYEGDIVNALKHNEDPFAAEIVWRSGVFWFSVWNWIEFQNIFRSIDVVGNVHENHELLVKE